MSSSKRRLRRERARARSAGEEAPPAAPAPALPEWKWRTFPVFLAFSFGGFLGMYLGWFAAQLENTWYTTVVFVFFATMLGFGLSRFGTRWLMKRGKIKPRSRR